MTYGEQRFQEYKRELSPEQKARQVLAIEALKEQAAYERAKNRKLVAKVKEASNMFFKFILVVVLGAILIALTSCNPQPIDECITFDLGPAGESYEVVPSNGLPGVIYVDGDRIKQDICPL